MFDVGFWELVLVGVIALLVIGPERLPGVVRVTGRWVGKMRQTAYVLKQELKDELYADEVRQTLSEYSPESELRQLSGQITDVADSVRAETQSLLKKPAVEPAQDPPDHPNQDQKSRNDD